MIMRIEDVHMGIGYEYIMECSPTAFETQLIAMRLLLWVKQGKKIHSTYLIAAGNLMPT